MFENLAHQMAMSWLHPMAVNLAHPMAVRWLRAEGLDPRLQEAASEKVHCRDVPFLRSIGRKLTSFVASA